jgi:hypothetical protein
MARFQLTKAFAFGSFRAAAGQIISDTPGVQTDLIWSGLNAQTMCPGLIPLDASATSMKAASRYASEVTPFGCTGGDSIR